jgi:hypothetical protein
VAGDSVATASESVAGIAKLAGDAASIAGANDTDIMTPHDALIANLDALIVPITGDSTPLSTGMAKRTFRMPYAFALTAVRASLKTTQTSGNIVTIDINEAGTSILSTKLTIDNGEKTSVTAATAAVISDADLADDAEITIDVDQIGDGTAAGGKVALIGHRSAS